MPKISSSGDLKNKRLKHTSIHAHTHFCRNDLYTRILDVSKKTDCPEFVEPITSELVELIPPFLRRLRFRSAENQNSVENQNSAEHSSEHSSLLAIFDELNYVLAKKAFAAAVPGQSPVEDDKYELHRLTVVEWADRPLVVCSQNKALCATYPPDVFGTVDADNSANRRRRALAGTTDSNETPARLELAMWRIRSPIHSAPVHSATSITHRIHIPNCPSGACTVAKPFQFSLVNTQPKSLRDGEVQCGHWDRQAGRWSTRGLFLIGITVDNAQRGFVMKCRSTHMTGVM